MQQERYVSSTKIIAVTLWATVASMMALAWILLVVPEEDYDMAAALLGLTAGAIAPAAGVIHMKFYAGELACLVRVTSGLDDAPAAEGATLRSVR